MRRRSENQLKYEKMGRLALLCKSSQDFGSFGRISPIRGEKGMN